MAKVDETHCEDPESIEGLQEIPGCTMIFRVPMSRLVVMTVTLHINLE